MKLNKRDLLKSIGTTGAAALGTNFAFSASAQSDRYPSPVELKGKEKHQTIDEVTSDPEAKKVLQSLREDGWQADFKGGKYRSVGENNYAVIPLFNKHASEAVEGLLLWLSDTSTQDENPHVAAYKKTELDAEYKISTTRVIDGKVDKTVSSLSKGKTEGMDGPSTDDYIPPDDGGCGTCIIPISHCDLLDQNWNCFVDIMGYLLSLPAFFAGCAICARTLNPYSVACGACLGALMQGDPGNLPCENGFYTDCTITDYWCPDEEAGYCKPE